MAMSWSKWLMASGMQGLALMARGSVGVQGRQRETEVGLSPPFELAWAKIHTLPARCLT